jgi:hypothetical protein
MFLSKPIGSREAIRRFREIARLLDASVLEKYAESR